MRSILPGTRRLRGGVGLGWAVGLRRRLRHEAHLLAIPALAAPAQAFGSVVRAIRLEEGFAQENLAHLAGIERSHMGKIERGEHMPTLALILKISAALSISAAELMSATERNLRADAQS